MTFKRLTDIAVRANASSSAPTSTFRRTTRATSPTTRASAPRSPAIKDALARGAAVMVTSHLGRPTEGEWSAADSWRRWPSASARSSARRCSSSRTGSTAARGSQHSSRVKSCCSRTAASTRARRRTTTRSREKMAKLCDVYCNDAFATAHRAEATTHGIAKYAPVACAGPLLAGRTRALVEGACASRAAAGRDRRRLQGLDQAHRAEGAGRESRCADRRWRHRQYVHPRRARARRQVAGRGRSRRRGAGDPRRVPGQGADPGRRRVREGVLGDRRRRR